LRNGKCVNRFIPTLYWSELTYRNFWIVNYLAQENKSQGIGIFMWPIPHGKIIGKENYVKALVIIHMTVLSGR
jgi:hypothetical protein